MSEYSRMQKLAGLIKENKDHSHDYDGDDNYDTSDDVEELIKKIGNLYVIEPGDENQKYEGEKFAYYIDGDTYVYIMGDTVILEYVDDEGNEIEKYRCNDIEEMAEYIINSYEGLDETTLVTKTTDSNQISDIAKREKTDIKTVQSAVNQAKQTGKPININEIEKNKMKKSEFRKFLKEEIKTALSAGSPVNEMAAIKGDIKTKVDQIIADNPDMEVGPLARLIMKDEEINAIIDRDNLSDMAQNQTQKYIKLVRGERELGKRGRKADPNKPASKPKSPKPQSGFSTEDMVKDLEAYSGEEMDAEDRKWKGKFHLLNNKTIKSIWDKYMGEEVPSPTEKDIVDPSNLNENESADYMRGYGDGYTDGYHDGENGEERAVEVNEGNLNEMAKITGSLADAIGAVVANNGDHLDGLALKKAIKADPDVIAALNGETLYDNQLNRFISLINGERELGKRGRKATPDKQPVTKPKPSADSAKPSTAKPSLKDLVDGDDEDIEDTWNKVDSDFDDDFDEDNVKDVEVEENPSLDQERIQTLKDQETKKFWRNFVSKMKEEGVIGSDNKPVDKEKLEAKRKEAQNELSNLLKNIK